MKLTTDQLQLIAYDFDGVMTDNHVIVFQDGTEAIIANRADGLGIDWLRKLEIPQIIISTETNPVVRARGKKLRLEVIDSCSDKREALISYCRKNDIDLEKVVFIGNDLNDFEVMSIVGYPVAPADAHPKIRNLAAYVTSAKGGEGVIKEFAERIMAGYND